MLEQISFIIILDLNIYIWTLRFQVATDLTFKPKFLACTGTLSKLFQTLIRIGLEMLFYWLTYDLILFCFVAKKRHQKPLFWPEVTVIRGWFCLEPRLCFFLVNLELAWSQRFDLVGSLGDILGYLPTKFEGPSWSGLVTVSL